MEFTIKKIGIVEEATVKLDGLTVIAGNNNSGKTTVGKALYAVTDAMARFEEEYEKDYKSAIENRIRTILGIIDPSLTRLPVARRMFKRDNLDILSKVTAVFYGPENIGIPEYEKLLQELYTAIKTDDILNSIKAENQQSEHWPKRKQKAMDACEEVLDFMQTQPEEDKYTVKLIDRFLDAEFQEQVQPLHKTLLGEHVTSFIQLRDETAETKYFKTEKETYDIEINIPPLSDVVFKSVFFFDDPFILDENMEFLRGRETHRSRLRKYMMEEDTDGIVETLYREEKLKPILDKINEIVPGTLTGSTYRSPNGMKLKAGNLATGVKVFSILKKILMNGDLTDKTLLILDEPESHLHPKWVAKLAELLVLLVKEQGVKVLLTTHSPDFLLATDAYMRKHGIVERCHFYQTEQIPDTFDVRYVEKTDDLNEIYSDYAESFAEMNALRKKYLYSEE